MVPVSYTHLDVYKRQAWQMRRRNPAILLHAETRQGYLIRLGMGCILLLISGWIGGHMVYAFGVGVR